MLATLTLSDVVWVNTIVMSWFALIMFSLPNPARQRRLEGKVELILAHLKLEFTDPPSTPAAEQARGRLATLLAPAHIARFLAALVLVGFISFCAYGFLAALEPGAAHRQAWQAAYGIAGLASLGGIILLFSRRR